MKETEFDELMSGEKLLVFMGYVLGAVALSGFVKLLLVPHTLGNALILLGVCGAMLYFAWTVITGHVTV